MNPGDSRANLGKAQEAGPFCEDAKRLLNEFGEAAQELIKLHEQQILAVVDGDLEANRFDLLIHSANERKQNAKYAYMSHLERHGCSQNK
jgi:hypothetical protein